MDTLTTRVDKLIAALGKQLKGITTADGLIYQLEDDTTGHNEKVVDMSKVLNAFRATNEDLEARLQHNNLCIVSLPETSYPVQPAAYASHLLVTGAARDPQVQAGACIALEAAAGWSVRYAEFSGYGHVQVIDSLSLFIKEN
ncbi:hypothetical protein NDU88_001165 [Pleurodeles waltl]|uniref:Uncharacterized protein n=1 Tax=Pleurodeles waltl TaxID=8319 RepID=A0AAV7P674_PLEWA|nr:hypothetical protein NDU88_001165 [Pleurodeles waltl]